MALAATDVFVATGSGLPLSSEAPLMPAADALRAALRVRRGPLAGEGALAVPAVRARLLDPARPELEQRDVPALPTRDYWTGHRLFSAVEATVRCSCDRSSTRPAHRGPALGRYRHSRPDRAPCGLAHPTLRCSAHGGRARRRQVRLHPYRPYQPGSSDEDPLENGGFRAPRRGAGEKLMV